MTTDTRSLARNPGPSWGYRFLRAADHVAPEWLYRPCRAIGTAVAMARMPEERRHSRDYLRLILGREPSTREVFRHFFEFEEALIRKLRILNGRRIECDYGPGAEEFRTWMETGGAVLLGTMHIGVSDMLGFQLGRKRGQEVYLVRTRVANSHDTQEIERRSGGLVKFVWVNDPGEVIFKLKEAAESGHPIALQCDRLEHSARTDVFEFLGARRVFPFTIYHLALIFGRPVILSIGTTTKSGRSLLHASPRFMPRAEETRAEALARAHAHFQEFLRLVESVLRDNPYVWFNYIPLNPVAEGGA